MIPALRVNPLFGRAGRPAQAIRHVAFPGPFSITEGVGLFGYTADDPSRFIRRRLRGDVTWYGRRGAGLPGDFGANVFRKIGGRLFLGGAIYDGGNGGRAVLFTAEDASDPIWQLKPIGIEGTGIASDQVIGIESNDTYIVVISSFGGRAVSMDGGETFTGYGSMGFTGPTTGLGFVNGLAASMWGFVAVADDGQLRATDDPRGVWPARTSQFGDDNIEGVVAGLSNFIAFGAGGKVSTALLTNPTSWTARSSGYDSILERGFCTGTRIFLSGFNGTWRESTDDTTWTEPADSPFKGEGSRARSIYEANGEIFVHWGNGQLSRSSDEVNWEEIENAGLPDDVFDASGYLAP